MAGISSWRPGFNPKPGGVGFVVDRAALETFFVRLIRAFPLDVIILVLNTHLSFITFGIQTQ